MANVLFLLTVYILLADSSLFIAHAVLTQSFMSEDMKVPQLLPSHHDGADKWEAEDEVLETISEFHPRVSMVSGELILQAGVGKQSDLGAAQSAKRSLVDIGNTFTAPASSPASSDPPPTPPVPYHSPTWSPPLSFPPPLPPSPEILALQNIKDQLTFDPTGALWNWNSEMNPNPCTWSGIECGSNTSNSGHVTMINLSGKQLQGQLSSYLQLLTFVETLDLSYNLLTGQIPPELGILPNLKAVRLNGNNFTGSLPRLANPGLQSLDLSHNQLSGSIPESFSWLHGLTFGLNLSHNILEGPIPCSFGSLTLLIALDLASNELTGEIPKSLANLTALAFLNVSNNQLSGPVPNFRNFSSSSFLDNPLLCGTVVGKLCPEVLPPRLWRIPETDKRKRALTVFLLIGGVIEGIVLLSFLFLLCWYFHLRRRIPKQTDVIVFFAKYLKVLNLTAEDIRFATSFTDTSGSVSGQMSGSVSGHIRRAVGFSNVEKAVLPDGTVFAVKQWDIAKFRKQARRCLEEEMYKFGKLRHQNLVQFFGFYMNADVLAMLLEFMPNGSLDIHLHPPGQHMCQLGWEERLRIVVGIAEGLVYLHNQSSCENSILHCDLKPANVLLDCDMQPKITDFGIARLVKRKCKGSTASSYVSPSGYVPPEYAFSNEMSTKGDIYSYGVLLLEVLSGKRPASSNVGIQPTLPMWVRSVKAEKSVHSVLYHSLTQDASDSQIAQMMQVLNIGLLCTADVPEERPNILEVVKLLKGVAETKDVILSMVDPIPPK